MSFADDQPRRHHYVFAHVALRQVVQRFGAEMPAHVRDGSLADRLAHLWRGVGESLPPDDRMPADGLTADLAVLDAHDLVLVTMPPALHTTEPHYAAIAVDRADSSVRYLLLEHTLNVDGTPATMLCEWRGETHVNMGAGPGPDLESFLETVATRLA